MTARASYHPGGWPDDVRALRMDRILEAADTDAAFEVPAGFDPADSVDAHRVYRAPDAMEVRVRYSPRIARWVRERAAGWPGGWQEESAGSVVVRHHVADPHRVVTPALTYGAPLRAPLSHPPTIFSPSPSNHGDRMKTTVLLDHEPVADGGWMVHALLRIEGEAPQARDRVPLNLSLVLDRSGSMAGEKLEAALQAAAMLVRRLSPEDTVSVVAFDDQVRDVAAPATGDAQEGLPDLIRSIPVGGSTNLSGGWLRGRDLVAANLRDGGVNRVILLTDGRANVGLTAPSQLTGLCATAAAAGVTTTTIGFGADFDEALLTAMADAGGGATYYIEQVDQASGVFEEELEGLLSIAAQNVRVDVEPGSGVSDLKVLHDYPSHAVGPTLTLEVGDLYAREPRRVLAAFLVPPEGVGAAGTADLGRFTVTAHVLTDAGGVELHEIALPLTLSPEEGGKVEPEVRKEILLLEAARVRREALDARERGDFGFAAEALRAYGTRVDASGLDDADLLEEARDLEGMANAFDARALDAADLKYMKQRAYARGRSRGEQVQRFRRER